MPNVRFLVVSLIFQKMVLILSNMEMIKKKQRKH